MTRRVLIASHLYPSVSRPTGAPWLREQVAELARQGVGLEVLCLSPFERDRDESSGPGHGVLVHYRSTSAGPLNGHRAGLAMSALRYRRRLNRFVRERRGEFGLVHAHFAFPDGWATAAAVRDSGVPFVLTVHGSDVVRILAGRGPVAKATRDAARQAACVVCVSEHLESEVVDVLGGGVRTAVIPNGYDDALFFVRDDVRDLGFVYVGALREVKGVRWLLAAYLATHDLHDTPLTIVGEGPLRTDLERMVASAPPDAAGRVTLRGSLGRSEVADALSRARAVVVPSEREGYGAVAAEALACGTPVAASAVGGLPAIVAGEAAGVLFTPGDTEALVEAMRCVREWTHDARDVAAASGARPWRDEAARIAALYAELSGERA